MYEEDPIKELESINGEISFVEFVLDYVYLTNSKIVDVSMEIDKPLKVNLHRALRTKTKKIYNDGEIKWKEFRKSMKEIEKKAEYVGKYGSTLKVKPVTIEEQKKTLKKTLAKSKNKKVIKNILDKAEKSITHKKNPQMKPLADAIFILRGYFIHLIGKPNWFLIHHFINPHYKDGFEAPVALSDWWNKNNNDYKYLDEEAFFLSTYDVYKKTYLPNSSSY